MVSPALTAAQYAQTVPFFRQIRQLEEQADGADEPAGRLRVQLIGPGRQTPANRVQALHQIRAVLLADDLVEQPIEEVDLPRQGVLAAGLPAASGDSLLFALDGCDRAVSHDPTFVSRCAQLPARWPTVSLPA